MSNDVEILRKLEAAKDLLTEDELAVLRTKLMGVDAYKELESFLSSLSEEQLLDYVIVLLHSVQRRENASLIALEIEESIVEALKPFTLESLSTTRLRSIIARQPIRPKRQKKEEEVIPAAIEQEEVAVEIEEDEEVDNKPPF